jgi:hypothetical protein
MYLLVHLVMRFVLGFLLVIWGAAWASVYIPQDLHPLARRALLAGVLVFAAGTMPGLFHYVFSPRAETNARDVAIAQALPRYGISVGDGVASIGDGQEAYWAHYAGVSVVAEIWTMDSAPFWSGPAGRQEVLHSMAEAGAKAAVWRRDSDQPCPPEWTPLPENSGCLIPLH